ncbi:TPA: phage tail protein, partial [Klebsiella pneumoniae]|nr:phage tail protein [Klebsiella pneumoniae]
MSKLTRRRFIGTLMPAIALELTSPINFCRAETIPPKIKIRAVQSLSSYNPSHEGEVISVIHEIDGSVKFVAADAKIFKVDGVKVIQSPNTKLVFVRDEYYSNRIVRPSWYGCRGEGKISSDTICFAKMLKSLVDGDHIILTKGEVYYNDFPNNSQDKDGWTITANNITLDGEGATLSRITPPNYLCADYTTLKITGDNCKIQGVLLITSDDPIGYPIMGYRSTEKLDQRELFCRPVANTLNLWVKGVNGFYVGDGVILKNAVFNFFANHQSNNLNIHCSAISSGQIYPQPVSKSSDLALGSSFKLDRCRNFMIKSTAINTAYAGVELEGNNTNGTVKIKTLKAYHAGLHIWNNSSDIKFDAYSEDITAGGGLIIGPGCKNCNGNSYVTNSLYVVAFVGDSKTGDLTGCDIVASGKNVLRGVEFYTRTLIDNSSIRNNKITLFAKYGDWGGASSDYKSGIVLNGGENNTIKAELISFDYILSIRRGGNNKLDIKYDRFKKRMYRENNPFFSNRF